MIEKRFVFLFIKPSFALRWFLCRFTAAEEIPMKSAISFVCFPCLIRLATWIFLGVKSMSIVPWYRFLTFFIGCFLFFPLSFGYRLHHFFPLSIVPWYRFLTFLEVISDEASCPGRLGLSYDGRKKRLKIDKHPLRQISEALGEGISSTNWRSTKI